MLKDSCDVYEKPIQHTKARKEADRWLGFFLLFAHFPMQYLFDSGNPLFGFETIHELFDLDAERAFTAWTSQALLLLSDVSILLYKAMPLVPRILSGGLLVLFAIDESISLHERFLDYFSEAGVRGSGFFTFTWLYVGVPLALTLTAAALQKHLPIGYFAGLVVFLVGAVDSSESTV